MNTPLNPTVKKLCGEYGIDPAAIQGSGKNGAILKADVEAAIAAMGRADLESGAAFIPPEQRGGSVPNAGQRPAVPSGNVSTELQPRHLEWLERSARINGRTVSKHLEWLIRQAYAADHTKAGLAGGMSSGPRGEFNPVTGTFG